MTQPNDFNDPWAVAASGHGARPAGYHDDPATNGDASFAGEYASKPAKQSSFFDEDFESYPVLFTQKHAPGTELTLTITAEPKQVQSTCHPSKAPDRKSRLKEYWVRDPQTGNRMPGLVAVDPATGKDNDPVWNMVLSGDTDERDPDIEGDDGRRSLFMDWRPGKAPRGHQIGAPTNNLRRAVGDAVKLDGKLTSDADFINRTLVVRRIAREDPNVSTSKWIWQARFVA